MIEGCISLFFVGFVAILSPGPDCMLMVRNSVRCPLHVAIATAIGINLGLCIHLSYALWIVLGAASWEHFAADGIRIGGALYLAYLGVKALRAGGIGTIPLAPDLALSPSQAFREGFLCNLLNPKAAAFMVSLLAQFVHEDARVTEGIAYAAVLLVQAILYWIGLAIIVQKTSVHCILATHGRLLDKVFGGVILAFSARMLLVGS